MSHTLGRVAFQLWVVLFLVFFGAESVQVEPMLRIATHLLFGIPLIVWVAARVRGPWDRLDLFVMGVLGIYTVVSLVSRDRTESFNTLGLAAAYAALFLLLRREAATGLREPIVGVVALGVGLSLAFNAWLLVEEKLRWYAALGRAPWEGTVAFPWESVNALPILVLLVVPFLAMMPRGAARTALMVVVGASALIVVPLSVGRAGWLAISVAVVALLILEAGLSQRVQRIGTPRRLVAFGAGAAFGVAALLVLAPRIQSALSESGRVLLWQQGLAMAAERPLFGAGPGTYSWTRLEYPEAGANLLAVRLIHNVPLQTVLDGGLLLAVAIGAVVAAWALAVSMRPGHLNRADRLAVAALIGFGASMLLDDFSYLPAVTVMVVVLAALLTPAPVRAATGLWSGAGPFAVLGVATLLALPHIVAVDTARLLAQSGREAAVERRWADAAEAFEAASAWHSQHAAYWLGLGMARSYLGDDAAAADAYRRARDAAPGDPRSYAALAALTMDATTQRSQLAIAATHTLGNPAYAVRLGEALADAGEMDSAIAAWGRAVALDTSVLGQLTYEQQGVELEQIADAALRALDEQPRPATPLNDAIRWDVALAINDLPTDAAPAWQAVASARAGETGNAFTLAERAIADAPLEARGYLALGAVATHTCDSAAVQAALSSAALVGGLPSAMREEPRIRREFVFREASLGPTQPAGVTGEPGVDPWPWSLVPMPSGCGT